MKSFGHINMQQNEFQGAVIQIESSFPANPIPGRLVFANQILYICVSTANGLPVWIPLTNEIATFEYTQATPSDTWVIEHDMQTTFPTVQVYGSDNKMILPDEVEIIDNMTVKVTFSAAIIGRAVIHTGSQFGGQRPQYSFEYTQSNAATTWVVPHNLGYHPIVRVFIGNEEVQPVSIVHDSNFQCTITFSQAQVGIVRCI